MALLSTYYVSDAMLSAGNTKEDENPSLWFQDSQSNEREYANYVQRR